MTNKWYQTVQQRWDQWRQQNPKQVIWVGLALILALYYFLVVSSSSYFIQRMQNGIKSDEKQTQWMAKAGQEVLRLRKIVPHEARSNQQPIFAAVNQTINDRGWNSLVTDVRQLDAQRVQVNFNSIAFNDLIIWLRALYDANGVYILEANLQKVQPGVVQASLVLQQDKK